MHFPRPVSAVVIMCVAVCLGTDMKLALPSSLENHYETLRLLYTDCQVVHGNLEITHLSGNPDLSFLQGIVEVQGYVLVAHVSVKLVPLDNLRIIRGSQLYSSNYSLAVLDNQGLETLRLRSLKEILLGGVSIWGNPQLCFPDPQSINLRDILDEQNTPHHRELRLQSRAPNCANCHPACENRCWGETEQDCQTLTRIICSGCQRCKGRLLSDCCHKQCAAGCTGPKDSDCLACRHFNDSGLCKEACPPATIYDTVIFQSKPNPDKRFSFGATCVKKCPYNYLAMEVACTLNCPQNSKEVIVKQPDGTETQKCEKCEGDCAKGGTQMRLLLTFIGNFTIRKCTKIFGSLAFRAQSYLYIDAWPEKWSNLSVFENLKVIRGRMLYM
uniref:receptor protein-tyrosine kinase n=1 Tax=Fundulus heteroclitus TaxID=8078 RepID=A0A3Q2P700_FUNHE